jgi:predicted 3-demethylubiquinone-9 3-methyltransferase (glyoxalase superfamily)
MIDNNIMMPCNSSDSCDSQGFCSKNEASQRVVLIAGSWLIGTRSWSSGFVRFGHQISIRSYWHLFQEHSASYQGLVEDEHDVRNLAFIFREEQVMQKITSFLWFDMQAEEAARFYVSVFKNSKVTGVVPYGEGGPMPKGTVMTVSFILDGQEFVALNGGPEFTFSPAISFVVNCDTQEEVDEFWEKLSEGGHAVQCGWITDKYGLSWQIVPKILPELLADPDEAKAQRVMTAMLGMIKIDIDALKQAAKNA